MIKSELSSLIKKINNPNFIKSSIIPWGSPILSFGDIKKAKISTIGLNPSNLEFVDKYGNELDGTHRRFHTLNSLGISQWSDIKDEHLYKILKSCADYFSGNPYDFWFKKLDFILNGTSISYYSPSLQACHLDLIPYATSQKWADLTDQERLFLLDSTCDTLGIILRNSSIKLLILNGQSVVDNLQKISNVSLEKNKMVNWTLPRKANDGVEGYSYAGIIKSLGGVILKEEIKVIGYNHNIQSSFGVTKSVHSSIQKWIAQKSIEV